MRLKYTGIYAPESTWEEVFYHAGTVLIQNGEVETDDELVIDALLKADFVTYEDWQKQEAERQEQARAQAEAENQEALAQATRLIRAKNSRSEQRETSGEAFVPFTDEELEEQKKLEEARGEPETVKVRVGDGVEEVVVHDDRSEDMTTERTVKDPEVSKENLPDDHQDNQSADGKAASGE